MASWEFLLIGSFAAVGAAMALGTIAALARYRRTGEFPGAPDNAPPSGKIGWLYVRIAVGIAVAVYGIASLSSRGLI